MHAVNARNINLFLITMDFNFNQRQHNQENLVNICKVVGNNKYFLSFKARLTLIEYYIIQGMQ